jgi:hypothetical protein
MRSLSPNVSLAKGSLSLVETNFNFAGRAIGRECQIDGAA